MLHVVEIGFEIQIDDSRLLLDNRLGYPVYRLMCCPVRPVSIRPRLEISFEDRLQDELQRPLATRSRIAGIESTRTFPPSFGISFFRTRIGRYVLVTKSSRICFRKLSAPLSSMASNVTPSIPGAPSLPFAIW